MLSRLFTSAKTLFAATPQTQKTGSREGAVKFNNNAEMVTTRQMGKAVDDSAADSIVVDTPPRSSRKRQKKSGSESDLAVETATPEGSASKKLKKLPVRVKDGATPNETPNRSTRVVVEIPVSKLSSQIKEDSAGSSTTSPVPKGSEEADGSKGSKTTPKSKKNIDLASHTTIEAGDVEEDVPSKSRKSPKSPSSKKSAQKPETLVEKAPAEPVLTKSKHKRFGSEEPEFEFFSTAVEEVESEDESSDDDAPEVVETHAAEKSVKLKARDAERAIEEQDSATRQKRKDRDAVLKKQAVAANKKRKRATTEEEASNSVENSITQHNLSRGPLPDLLPAEYLEDDEPELSDSSDIEPPVKLPKKMKFTDLIEKKPKDRRRGSVTYRVSEVRSTKLAPKAVKQARSLKESWLQGQRGKAPGSNRKPWSTGFFKKR